MSYDVFSAICDIDGERLDIFLSRRISGVSRTRIQSLIDDKMATVSGKAQKRGYKLSAGETVELRIPPNEPPDIKPVNIPLDVVFEDNDIIVINKPKNMVVHPAPGHFDDTLVNALMYHCGDKLSGINGVLRPGIVHRIDKDTTGLIVAAKTNEAHLSLSEQISEKTVERVYEAVVFGVLKDDEGSVNAPIGRNEKDRQKMCVNPRRGKPAVTHYKALERFEKYTHIRVRLETGRTHQIRVHMAHIGFPVLGDTVYSNRKQPFKTEGQVLHARTIGFTHPVTKEYMRFESELPDYFAGIIGKIRNPYF